MKFRFLGGMDCPDWLLSQIAAFSKLTSLKFKSICQVAVEFQVAEASAKEIITDSLSKLATEKTGFIGFRFVTIIAEWLLKKPAGNSCSASDLENEMTQLGMPPEHSKMLSKVYDANLENLKQNVADKMFKEPSAQVLSVDEQQGKVHLTFQSDGAVTDVLMTRGQFAAIKKDAQSALVRMEEFASN